MRRLDTDRIAHLANQIAQNQHAISEQEAIEIVSDHIQRFWNSSMINLLKQVEESQLHDYCKAARQNL